MHDKEIRKAFTDYLRQQLPSGSIILHEVGLCEGASRIDLCVIGDDLEGFEIKSEYDSLVRLPSQMNFYNHVMDRISIVTSVSHIEKAKKVIPAWWGIYTAVSKEGTITITELSPPSANPNLDGYAIAQLLWKDEVISVLNHLGIFTGLQQRRRSNLWKSLSGMLSPDDLRTIVRSKMRQRMEWVKDHTQV
jgi:hypothetical protein